MKRTLILTTLLTCMISACRVAPRAADAGEPPSDARAAHDGSASPVLGMWESRYALGWNCLVFCADGLLYTAGLFTDCTDIRIGSTPFGLYEYQPDRIEISARDRMFSVEVVRLEGDSLVIENPDVLLAREAPELTFTRIDASPEVCAARDCRDAGHDCGVERHCDSFFGRCSSGCESVGDCWPGATCDERGRCVCPESSHPCGACDEGSAGACACQPDDSVDHCGSACTVCPREPHATVTCELDSCATRCDAGYRMCAGACLPCPLGLADWETRCAVDRCVAGDDVEFAHGTIDECTGSNEEWHAGLCCGDWLIDCVRGTPEDCRWPQDRWVPSVCAVSGHPWCHGPDASCYENDWVRYTGSYCCALGDVTCVDDGYWGCTDPRSTRIRLSASSYRCCIQGDAVCAAGGETDACGDDANEVDAGELCCVIGATDCVPESSGARCAGTFTGLACCT